MFDLVGSSEDEPERYAISKPNTSQVNLNSHMKLPTETFEDNYPETQESPKQKKVMFNIDSDEDDNIDKKNTAVRRRNTKRRYNERKSEFDHRNQHFFLYIDFNYSFKK